MARVYEFGDKSFGKSYVKGFKNDSEAKKFAKKNMGKCVLGVSYYDNVPSKYPEYALPKDMIFTRRQFEKYSKMRFGKGSNC